MENLLPKPPPNNLVRTLAVALLLLGCVLVASAQSRAAKPLPWFGSLVEGYANALRKQEPILVKVGASWCGWCKKLDEELAKPKVQAELRRWTLVALDLDKSSEAAKTLGVGPVPALRILNATGRQVAAHDGYLTEDKLLAWLRAHHATSELPPAEVLTGKEAPTGTEITKLVALLAQRDPAVREAAVRRLLPYPDVAAPAVASAFAEGALQTRLAALELLQSWQAPTAELDPWQPASFSPDKLQRLAAWAKAPRKAVNQPVAMPADVQSQAQQEITRMLKASTPAEAAAVREQLARHGKLLLPFVYARLKTEQNDQHRERLIALRYRLVASERLALLWPSGIEQLASVQTTLRNQAAQELARRATAEDEPLLLELFSDPDPLIREISLRALHTVAGVRATDALTKLLADPDPNVRTAVLKQLEERPNARLMTTIAQFTGAEKDPDLLVHAIRVLRTLKHKDSVDCLKRMLAHENWRVRAEAADILCGYVKERYTTQLDQQTINEVYEIFLKLLEDEDGFVVSRGVKGLQTAQLVKAVDPLAKVVAKHPDLAKEVTDALQQLHQKRDRVLEHLRAFCRDRSPEVRAVAIVVLCQMQTVGIEKEVHASLQDDDSHVRRAGATALFTLLQNLPDSPLRQAQTRWQQQTQGRFVAPSMSPPPKIAPLDLPVPAPRSPPSVPRSALPPPRAPEVVLGEVRAWYRQAQEEATAQDGELLARLQSAAKQERDFSGLMDPRLQGRGMVPATQENNPSWPLRSWSATAHGIYPLMLQAALSGEQAAGLLKQGRAYDLAAENFLAGKGRQKWVSDCIPLLKSLLQAKNAEERLAAALCLVALGQERQALAIVLEAAKAEPILQDRAAGVLSWLPWERRIPVFRQLLALAPGEEEWRQIVLALASCYDPRTIPLLWEVAAQSDLKSENSGSLLLALLQAYFGTRYLYDGMQLPQRYRPWAEQAACQRVQNGPELQRLIALGLLAVLQPQQAHLLADKVVNDPSTPPAVRQDAWQIMLYTQGTQKGQQLAARELTEADGDIHIKALALRVVAFGLREAGSLRGGKFNLEELHNRFVQQDVVGGGELPRGLHSQHVKPFITDPRPRTAAAAAYLLTLLGEQDQLEPLLRYWSSQAPGDERVIRMVYRAVTTSGDDAHVPVLEAIYRRFLNDQPELVRDMLQQMHNMKGPAAQSLRRRIEQDLRGRVGANRGAYGNPIPIPHAVQP